MATTWVESFGGPLIAVPLSALAHWRGGDAEEEDDLDDYARACAVEGLAGVIDVGPEQALVLADGPATSCYLPELRAFVRWEAADGEPQLLALARAILGGEVAADWDECGFWMVDGPALLMDSAVSGEEVGRPFPGGGTPSRAPVEITPGRWRVQATWVESERTWVGVVRLGPV